MTNSSFSHPQRSLVVTSLEIGRVLADRNGVTFRAQGTCMYPTIRPGDVLRIKSCPVTEVAIGDIAVCRRPDFLFSHRVIDKNSKKGLTYIVTRPDRAKNGHDGQTFEENLLGVVVEIRRKGQAVPLLPTKYPLVIRNYFILRLKLIEGKQRLIWYYADRLTQTNIGPYLKVFTRIWFLLFRPKIGFSICVPLHGSLGEAVYRPLKVNEFDPAKRLNGRDLQRWTLLLQLNSKPKPAAWMFFVLDADGNWQVEDSYTRLRYRGLGFEQILKARADAIIEVKT